MRSAKSTATVPAPRSATIAIGLLKLALTTIPLQCVAV